MYVSVRCKHFVRHQNFSERVREQRLNRKGEKERTKVTKSFTLERDFRCMFFYFTLVPFPCLRRIL